MKTIVRLVLFLSLLGLSHGQNPGQITTFEITWKDAARNREVPVKIYAPPGKGPFPVIVFSHGLGGSREGYEYLGTYWAEHGYISVHPQHLGSDDAVWKEAGLEAMKAMQRAVIDPANLVNRPLDIHFVIDQITQLNQTDGEWKGRFDLDHIGVGGHSFGAYTAMAIAGETFFLPGGGERNYRDARIKAVIAMSAQPPVIKSNDMAAYATVQIPVFHMTGTLDRSPLGGPVTPEERQLPYQWSSYPQTYLLVFQGGDHMVFSGRGLLTRPSDREFERLVQLGSTAFWDAYLKGDAGQRAWLDEGGFARELGKLGTFEEKSQKGTKPQ